MSAVEAVARFFGRLADLDDPAVFISTAAREQLMPLAEQIDAAPEADVPLRGLVFAAKDNIDIVGLATTAGCPGYARRPERSATIVERLVAAGALPVAKTNLDQFATGLVGTRSPYGVPVNPLDPTLVPGGSSSGSAVAVARGLVDFALGTDTAGSGRVPAAMCGIVGLKPTFGRLPCTGIVPAVRSADCASIFARGVDVARAAMDASSGVDPADSWSRPALEPVPDGLPLRVGVVPVSLLHELGCATDVIDAYGRVLDGLGADPATVVTEIAIDRLFEAGDLLYGSAFVAERTAAVGHVVEAAGADADPVVAEIIREGSSHRATDVFDAMYRLSDLRVEVARDLDGVDGFVLPTVRRAPTVADVERSPRDVNTDLGRFTTFANLLGMCALTVPVGGAPRAGESVTFYASEWRETTLCRLSSVAAGSGVPAAVDGVRLVVAGAHLRGQPLAHQLEGLGGVWSETTATSPCYRLFALPGGPPHKPALVHDQRGASIEVDVWRLDAAALGRFVQMIPAPLGLGRVTLTDGSDAVGFIAEGRAVDGATEITHLGGWRAYVSSLK